MGRSRAFEVPPKFGPLNRTRLPEAISFKLCGHGRCVQHDVISFFGFGWRYIADRLQKAAVIEHGVIAVRAVQHFAAWLDWSLSSTRPEGSNDLFEHQRWSNETSAGC